MANQQLPLPLPHPTASPSEVRTYFSALLTTHHGLPPATAALLVAPWALGRGAEITYYSRPAYIALFGPEVGELLFGYANGLVAGDVRGVRTSRARSERETAGVRDLFGLPPRHTVLGVLGGATLLLVLAARATESRGVAVAHMCAAAVSFVAFLVAYSLIYFR